ncbi:XRE family transcriptional regulator [Streptomyces deserti]
MPDELDPQIREFTSQLRRLVDRSGLSIASVADRTGYSKTSWERYLNGRLLAPKGAIVALAEVTGTNPVHLTTMWELAERAWSRSEMRHDMTMEAIRISQARAALSEFGAPQAGAAGGRTARKGRSATVTPGVAGPAGVVPAQPAASDVQDSVGGVRDVRDAREDAGRDAREDAGRDGSSGTNSWGVSRHTGPSGSGGWPSGGSRSGTGTGPRAGAGAGSGAGVASGPVSGPRAAGAYGEPPRDAARSRARGRNGKGRMTMFVAGVVGVLVVVAGAFYLTESGGDDKNKGAAQSPSPTVSANPNLPAGVKCSGDSCTGKDAESMGCSGDLVTTAKTATVGTAVVEVRYSETCRAAWGRVTQAAQGDEVQVTAGKAKQSGSVTVAGDTIAYTPMVAVKNATEAKACVALASGQEGCTE